MSTRRPLPDERYDKAELWFHNTKHGDLESLQIYRFTTINRTGSLGSHTSNVRPIETKERELLAIVKNPSDELKQLAMSQNKISLIRFEFGGNPATIVGLHAKVVYIDDATGQIKVNYQTP